MNFLIISFQVKNADRKDVEIQGQIFTRKELIFGRHPGGAQFSGVGVSRQHFCLLMNKSDNSLYIKDLASTHGTFLNGRQIKCEQVQVGDHIQFGDHEIFVRSISLCEVPQESEIAQDVTKVIDMESYRRLHVRFRSPAGVIKKAA